MSKWLAVSLVALSLIGFSMQSSPARAVSIDWNLAGAGGAPVSLTNQFASQGVLFSNFVIDNFCSSLYCGVVQQINVGGTQYYSPVSLTFSNAGQDAYTTFVSMRFLDGNIGSGLIKIQIFDLDGDQLALQTYTTPGVGQRTISACASGCDINVTPEIHRIVLSDTAENDGTVIETLSFDAVTTPPLPVPEPTTGAVLGLGLALLGWSRRR